MKLMTKKWILVVVVLSMLVTSLFVGQARAFERNKGIQAGELVCGFVGGTIAGAVARNVGGASDPVTFLAALIGGVIGTNYCDYLNNQEKQVIREIVADGLNRATTGTDRKVNDKYYALIDIKGTGSRTNFDGRNQKCVKFMAAVYQQNPSKYLGYTEKAYWACGEGQNWEVVSASQVSVDRRNGSYGSSSGTSSNDRYASVRTEGIINSDRRVTVISNSQRARTPVERGVWDLRNLPRFVFDPASFPGKPEDQQYRHLELFTHLLEKGRLAGVSSDGVGVRVHFNSQSSMKTLDDSRVAVECGPRETSHICTKRPIHATVTEDGVRKVIVGEIRFMFKNGTVVVAPDLNYGTGDWEFVPAELVPQ